ncbi:MAG: 50S ribosomal protein L23 [Halobacteria archaeon]|nr:50S ribosomal protein L23 [Halobacteria archaeon]
MSVIVRPHITEKAMDLMDFDNKMQFIVDLDATKDEIQESIETAYDVEVADVNTQITMDGEKKATVTFVGEEVAQDLASRIGAF